MSGAMEKRKFTITVGPSVILLVLLLMGGAFLLRTGALKRERALTIEKTAIITTRIRTLGELTTACFYDEIVLNGTKKNPLWKDWNDHLVIIAHGTVRAGIDLQKMDSESVRFSGDTVIVRLPNPEYLDIIVNPSDFDIFAETGRWTQQQVSKLQDSARQRLIAEADYAGLKRTAYEGAMQAVGSLLTASGYTLIRFDHPAFYFPMPGEDAYLR